jgi:pimeloyl-ACP methyl ester carboxylesterase
VATYVLVPGAWLGGWAWQDVAARLRAKGHDVYPITLTGLGERVHLARPEIDLETHITDVVNTIAFNDLKEVILAGHSYSGIVVTGVADRIPERLAQLVYVDSAPFPNGLAFIDLYPPEARAGIEQAVKEFGDGWRLLFPGIEGIAKDASLAGLSDDDKALMAAKAMPQPWRSYTQPLSLRSNTPPTYELVAIACDDMRHMVAAGVPQIVPLSRPPWHYLELQTGHWPMFSAPDALAETLDGLSSG